MNSVRVLPNRRKLIDTLNNQQKLFLIVGILISFLILGCTTEQRERISGVEDAFEADNATKAKDTPANLCISLCKEYLANGTDLSKGPCLSNAISDELGGWVCDVAHSPRQSIDNEPSNQCEAFRNGTAKHFVEVDQNCNLIRQY